MIHIALFNYAYNPAYSDPDALLEHDPVLKGWAEALLEAGAARVTVGQRFWRDLNVRRNGVEYLFRNDDGGPLPRALTWPRELHQDVVALQPDIAHVNGLLFPTQLWALRQALAPGTALVVQDHADKLYLGSLRDTRFGGPPASLRWAVLRLGLRCADGFIFATEEHARLWQAARLIGRNQPIYEVLEASQSLQPIARTKARAAGSLHGAPALLWVGPLNEQADPLTVLAGFERAALDLPDAHLTLIYTSEALLPQVRARLAASPILSERVSLLGNVPASAMSAFYSAADIFVLGSQREDTGYALIDALACGAIPVVTDIPVFRAMTCGIGMRTITTEGSPLWTPGDAGALAAALAELGRRSLTPLHDAVYAHFEQSLSWAVLGQQALAAYTELLQGRADNEPQTRTSVPRPAASEGRPTVRDSS